MSGQFEHRFRASSGVEATAWRPSSERIFGGGESGKHTISKRAPSVSRKLLHVVSDTSWSALDDLRSFVQKYCERHLNRGQGERANLAAQELLEAASKCSSAIGELQFELDADTKPTTQFEIRVGTEMVDARQRLLQQRIDMLQRSPPSQVYRNAVDALASGSGDEQMLSLARIRADDINVSLHSRGNFVTLIARSSS